MVKREVVRESTKKENDRHGRVTTGKVIEKKERQKRKENILKVHKIEIFLGFDFEICIISLLVM